MPSVRSIARGRKGFSITTRDISFSGTTGNLVDHDTLSTLSGSKVSEAGALRIAAAWIANTVIADEVSSLPLKLVRRDDVSRRPEQPNPVRPLWDRPNPDQMLMTFWATSSLSMTLWGCSYTQLGWQNSGDLGLMWPIDPGRVGLERIDNGLKLVSSGQGELVNVTGQRPEFMMVPLYQMPGQLQPVSPVRYAAELLGLSAAYDATAASLMGRGFNPAAVLTSGEKVDPEDAEKLAARLTSLHSGSRSGGVAVLGGKDLKLEKLTMSLADAEFMAQRQDVFNVVMALWRVPPTVAGMVDKPSTWGTGVAEFSRGLERFTLRPIILRLQAGIETYILRWVDDALQARFKFDALLAAAPKDRAEVQRANLASGITSVERVLAQNDEPPFEDGETVFSQLALATDEDRRLSQLRQRADTYVSLVRAGVTAEAAAEASGFDPNQLTGGGFVTQTR
jgi:HK97 family phage portal protein